MFAILLFVFCCCFFFVVVVFCFYYYYFRLKTLFTSVDVFSFKKSLLQKLRGDRIKSTLAEVPAFVFVHLVIGNVSLRAKYSNSP